jgi:DNA-binding transcriptional regulator LsrR (DeoR family)
LTGQEAPGPAALVLTATVARRYYLDGATKTEIAAELGLSRFKVARLLEEARTSGIVRIELDSSGQIDLDLSVRLAEAFGLQHCVVMDGPEDDEALLRGTLGRAAADLVTEIVEEGDVLGLAWARSLMPIRTSIGQVARCDVVQLTGALSLPHDESPASAAIKGGRSVIAHHCPAIERRRHTTMRMPSPALIRSR